MYVGEESRQGKEKSLEAAQLLADQAVVHAVEQNRV